MSKKTKEKVKLFEKAVFPDVMTAQEMYDKEEKRFKIRLICTCVSLATSLITFPSMMATMGGAAWADTPVFEAFVLILLVVGIAATVASGPLGILKFTLKVVKVCYFIIPIIFIDLFAAALGAVACLYFLLFAPVVFSAFNLYQSYINRKEAAAFLALNNSIKESTTYEEN